MRSVLQVGGLGFMLAAALGATSARAAVVVEMSDRALAARADCVVRGEVVAAAARRETRGGVPMVVTDYTLRTVEALGGVCPATLVVTELGGRVGGRRHVVPGAPAYRVGARVVAFLQALEHAADGRFRTVGMAQGLFFERRTPESDVVVLVRDVGGLTVAAEDADGVLRPREGDGPRTRPAVRLDDVRRMIESARAGAPGLGRN
jgi:hypothetical protein